MNIFLNLASYIIRTGDPAEYKFHEHPLLAEEMASSFPALYPFERDQSHNWICVVYHLKVAELVAKYFLRILQFSS